MIISLPHKTMEVIETNCVVLLNSEVVTVRDVAKVTGRPTACAAAVFSASPSTDGKNKDTTGISQLRGTIDIITRSEIGTPLVESLSGDMEWEKPNNCRPDMILTSDASKRGWVVTWGNSLAQGQFSQAEQKLHMNCLECMASGFAVRAFTKGKSNFHVHLLVDDTRHPRPNMLLQIVKELCDHCLANQIILTACHLSGSLGYSQIRAIFDAGQTNFPPNKQILGSILGRFVCGPFNCQLKKIVSWKPDPLSVSADEFQMEWKMRQAYAFPPFCLIGRDRCLAKLHKYQSQLVLM